MWTGAGTSANSNRDKMPVSPFTASVGLKLLAGDLATLSNNSLEKSTISKPKVIQSEFHYCEQKL